jgi:hypothetical protein
MNTDHRRANRIAVNLPTVIDVVGPPPVQLHPKLSEVYERLEPARERIGHKFPAAIRDLSTNGAFVAGEPLPLLSRVVFDFPLAGMGRVEVVGWTMWRRSAECELPVAGAGVVVLPPGFGVLFEAIALDARLAIHKLVSGAGK